MKHEWYRKLTANKNRIIRSAAYTTSALLFIACNAIRDPTPTVISSIVTETPTLTPIPTATATAIPVLPQPKPTVIETQVKEKETIFDVFMMPFIDAALKNREERRRIEPEWSLRIDEELNKDRINFLLYGYGKSLELKSKDDITGPIDMGSSTIVSYNVRTKTIDFISFSHDIRSPEIEQLLRNQGKKPPVQKIDRAFPVGGFDLMKYVHENASGFVIDYQITFKEAAIRRIIETVFNNVIEVNVPENFDVQPFMVDGQRYPAAHFSKGKQILTGLQVIQYIKTVPVPPNPDDLYYGKPLEHKSRMYDVFRGILNELSRLNSKKRNEALLKAASFILFESRPDALGGTIQYDNNTFGGMINLAKNMQSVVPTINRYIADDKNGLDIPPIGKTIYIHDDHASDGGVIWVSKTDGDLMVQEDFGWGVYSTEYDMAVPREGNPYDPRPYVRYWPFLRAFIKQKILE